MLNTGTGKPGVTWDIPGVLLISAGAKFTGNVAESDGATLPTTDFFAGNEDTTGHHPGPHTSTTSIRARQPDELRQQLLTAGRITRGTPRVPQDRRPPETDGGRLQGVFLGLHRAHGHP